MDRPAGNVLVLLPQEKKRRREENLKRRLENERKAEIVQVVSCSPTPGWGHHGSLANPAASTPWALGSSLLQFLSAAPPLKAVLGKSHQTQLHQGGGHLCCHPTGWGGGTASPSSLRKPGRGLHAG